MGSKKRFAIFVFFTFLLIIQPIPATSLKLPVPLAIKQRVNLQLSFPYVPGEFLIKFKVGSDIYTMPSFDGLVAKALTKDFKFKSKSVESFAKYQGMDRWFVVSGFNPSDEFDVLSKLYLDPRFEKVEPNYLCFVDQDIPDDPLFPQQWALENTGQTGGKPGADIKALVAWKTDIGNGYGKGVAIVDTGVDYDHPDLQDVIVLNQNDLIDGKDNDENGFVDDFYGWNFVDNSNKVKDDFGHGTHVAGISSAKRNNNLYMAGINRRSQVGIIKFLDYNGTGKTSDAAKSIIYSVMMGFKISNHSWGGGGYSSVLYDAISMASQAGQLFIASAGNSGLNTDIYPHYPSTYKIENIISVAATDHNDNLFNYSNYGSHTVHLGAPGVSILSLVPKGSCTLCSSFGYNIFSGTSMAAPMVSGAVSLLWDYYESKGQVVDHLFIKNKILLGTDVLVSLNQKTKFGGRLNLANILEEDLIAPSAVSDLKVLDRRYNGILVQFSAVGDDNLDGSAARYQLRYSTKTVAQFNFDQATELIGTPLPKKSGELIQFLVDGFEQNTVYSFAVKAFDNVGNASGVSNVISEKTTMLQTLFSDGFDGPDKNWTVSGRSSPTAGGLWHKTQKRYISPNNSYYYGQELSDDYDTGYWNYGSLESPAISLNGFADPFLEFQSFLHIESEDSFLSHDLAFIEASQDGGKSWRRLVYLYTSDWVKYKIDLSSYAGVKNFKFRFFFNSVDQYGNNHEGWYVDDIYIYASAK